MISEVFYGILDGLCYFSKWSLVFYMPCSVLHSGFGVFQKALFIFTMVCLCLATAFQDFQVEREGPLGATPEASGITAVVAGEKETSSAWDFLRIKPSQNNKHHQYYRL